MAVKLGLINAVTTGIARMLGLSRTARLRRSIADHTTLYGGLQEHDGLTEAAGRTACGRDRTGRIRAARPPNRRLRIQDRLRSSEHQGTLGKIVETAAGTVHPARLGIPKRVAGRRLEIPSRF